MYKRQIIAYESDIAAVTQTAQAMMCEPGKRIYDYVGEENYNAAVQLLEAFDLYYEEFDYFLPVFWISMQMCIRDRAYVCPEYPKIQSDIPVL